jgi:D-xylose transport system permease protein
VSSTAAPPEIQSVVEGDEGLASAFSAYIERLKAGDVGSLPVIFGLVVATIYFTARVPVFFSANNFVNLITQLAVTALIAIGVVFVLLIGEIDLSIGSVTGVCAVCVAWFQEPGTSHTVSPYLAIVFALALGLAIGFLQGSIIAIIGVPSFVVTLAGLLVFAGVIIEWIGSQVSINVEQGQIVYNLANYYLPKNVGWLAAIVVSVAFGLSVLWGVVSRRRAGLPVGNVAALIARVVLVTVVTFTAVGICNHTATEGVPLAGVLLVALIAFWTFISRRTTFGRHVYAVGGGAEAARRSGINVRFIRIAVFMISGLMAAVGGIVLAGALGVAADIGSHESTFLNAIAAAVIGGTSLTGGRGRVVGALLGAAVIGTIANGLDLIGSTTATNNIITGLILLAAVTLDTLATRKLAASGR